MDWFDDFEDDFENDDGFEDEFEQEPEREYKLSDESEPDDEFDTAESRDDDKFTAKDAFFLSSAIGFGYEEGLRSRGRKKRSRFVDDDSD